MPHASIALGSNVGDSQATLLRAVETLRSLGTVTAVSPFVSTAPVGYVDQPDFLNGAAVLETELSPADLLQALLHIELQHGRDRSHGIAKGPRTLDLDLLLYDEVVLQTPELTLPHPAMHLRGFVLGPLAAIAPGWMHPVLHRTVAEMLAAL